MRVFLIADYGNGFPRMVTWWAKPGRHDNAPTSIAQVLQRFGYAPAIREAIATMTHWLVEAENMTEARRLVMNLPAPSATILESGTAKGAAQ